MHRELWVSDRREHLTCLQGSGKPPHGKGLSSWAFDSHGHKWGGGQCGVKAGACASESDLPGSESLLCDLR